MAAPSIYKAGSKRLPDRIIINGVEGVGKTTIGAYSDSPILLTSREETGVHTLASYGLIPEVDTIDCQDWAGTLSACDSLIGSPYQTVVLDALGGFERLCHEHVCQVDFNGDWGKEGFLGYNKGFHMSVTHWLKLLVRLDRLREDGKAVLLLSHVAIKNHKNPLGSDYDRYVADLNEKTWGPTHKWADAVFFYTFYTIQKEGKREEKKIKPQKGSGTERVIYTERCDAYDAKNRFGMPSIIPMPTDPAQAWATIKGHMAKE